MSSHLSAAAAEFVFNPSAPEFVFKSEFSSPTPRFKSSAKSSIATNTDQLSINDSKIATLEEQNCILLSEKDEMKRENDALIDELKTLKEQNQSFKDQAYIIKRESIKIEEENETFKKEIQSLKYNIDTLKNEIKRLESDLTRSGELVRGSVARVYRIQKDAIESQNRILAFSREHFVNANLGTGYWEKTCRRVAEIRQMRIEDLSREELLALLKSIITTLPKPEEVRYKITEFGKTFDNMFQ